MDSRTPPQNLEAEQSVLGSILLDNEVYAQIEGTLQADHFYKESHRKIWRACERLFRRNEPMDLVTLTEELRQTGELEAVGSVPYLIGLADSVPTAAYADSYARIVAEKAVLRDLISASGSIMQTAYDQALPLEQILDKAESGIFELSSNKRTHAFEGMPSLVADSFAQINELFTNPDPITGLRTGFKELDNMTAGLQPSSLNVLAARPSMGKCLGKGTKVVMCDGTLKAVEDLRVGDALLGPDSRLRPILSLARGREMMYWVRQRHGLDYRVNESHILSLKRSRCPNRGEVVNISVREWLAKSPKFQNDAKGYKVAVELPEKTVPIEPYFLGLWLGDGASESVRVTTGDEEVVSYLRDYAARLGLVVSVDAHGERCPSYALTRGRQGGSSETKASSLQGQLAALGVLGNKHIPQSYLLNSRKNRLELLAGLIDSDGHYLKDQNGPYEITTKRKRLAEEIKYLCDSLGYRTSLTAKTARLTSRNYTCEVYRVRFNGDVDEIPVRIPRKRAAPWTDFRDWRVTGIRVEQDCVDDFYGFTLGGDGLFLLQDMTVTHNTALALTIGQSVALREGKAVGIFNLEMSAIQLVMRMLCSEARVDMSRVRNGQLSDRDFQRLADTAGKLSDTKIFIDDAADMTVMELRSRSRRLMAEHDLGLIVIDYLQLMQGSSRSGGGENRQQEISNISRGLKLLARELDIPVLVLSQLSRAVESRPNKRPMLSDLRECVTGDTLVNLADGRRTPIRDLVGQKPEVLAMTPAGHIVPATSELVWEVGVKPVFEIRTRTGRTLRATGEHRVYQLGGWTTVAELKLGDRLALARSLPEPAGAAAWDEDRLALLGQLVGDGSYLKGQPLRYTTASEENSAQVRRAAEGLGSTVNRYEGRGNWHQLVVSGNGHRWQAKGVGAWLKDLGIFDQRSSQKRLPGAVFTLDQRSVATLLRHLWATDGCIFVRTGGGSSRVYFATCSEGLARDVAALLLRLGVVGRLKRVTQKTGQPLWNVEVSGRDAQLRFLDTVGAFGPRLQAAAALRGVLEGQKGNPNLDTLPHEIFSQVRAAMAQNGVSQREMAAARGTSYGGSSHFRFAPSRAVAASYAAVLGDAALATLATNDLYWDEVLSVTPVGHEQVYDLTVPGPASWLADGLVSHNSGAIEQDADLVMFIYRDEYYDPHSEKQGIAEIILGKQRNGPVGTVELQFHNAHVRFNDLAKQQ